MNRHMWIFAMLAVVWSTGAFGQQRAFTVRDSIEMATFSVPYARDPASTALKSPDHKYFAVVTSRGIVESDQIESSLWIIDALSVRRFLLKPAGSLPSPPKLAAKIAGVPPTSFHNTYTYQPLITDLRWDEHSPVIYYLAVSRKGTYRLCSSNVATGKTQQLTGAEQNVDEYSVQGHTIVYRTSNHDPSSAGVGSPSANQTRRGAFAVTGLPIDDILFSHRPTVPGVARRELWVINNNRTRRIPAADSLLDGQHDRDVLAISPSGRQVVQLQPVPSLPALWESYIPQAAFESWRLRSTDPNTTSPTNPFRVREYVLTDIENGKSHPLVSAPYGEALAYSEGAQAVWSPTGSRLLISNSFLPLNGVDDFERQRRMRPCTVVVLDMPSGEPQCLAYTRESITNASVRLRDVSFGSSEDDVIIHFSSAGRKLLTERYRRIGEHWSEVESFSDDRTQAGATIDTRAQRDTLCLSVKQSLNDPPALYATDTSSGKAREVWDPNPQFANIRFGRASVYHWKASDGVTWTGGLVLPVNYVPGTRYPLIIQTHGFLDHEFITDGQYPTAMAARPLASAGFVVLQVGNTYAHTEQLREASDYVSAFESAVRELDVRGLIDTRRVGIIGFSRTCWYVESALIRKPNLFAAASITDGVDQSYMQTMLFYNDRKSEGRRIYDAPPFGSGLDRWMNDAPGFHLDRVQTPLMITAIGPLSLLLEWETYSSLYQQAKPVDFMYIPKGQHVLQEPAERFASQQGNVDWFRFWLQDYERPNPQDNSQYIRWRRLQASTTNNGQPAQ